MLDDSNSVILFGKPSVGNVLLTWLGVLLNDGNNAAFISILGMFKFCDLECDISVAKYFDIVVKSEMSVSAKWDENGEYKSSLVLILILNEGDNSDNWGVS